MITRNLTNTPIEEIVDTLHEAFSDYFVTVKPTIEQFKNSILSNNFKLELSAGAFDNSKLIGFVHHGIDEIEGHKIAYNGGTGVIPYYRGNQITSKLYEFLIPQLIEIGIKKVILEVITKNKSAIKTYEKIGFIETKKYDCLKGYINCNIPENSTFFLKELEHYDWKILTSFWDFTPSWQNSKQAVTNLKGSTISIGAHLSNQLVGYLIYNPTSNKVMQFGVDKHFRNKGIGSLLFKELAKSVKKEIVITNTLIDSANTSLFLKSIGFESFIQQNEMELTLI
jgi:ribosomal protein S18 acetylase RimI-like enzyme